MARLLGKDTTRGYPPRETTTATATIASDDSQKAKEYDGKAKDKLEKMELHRIGTEQHPR